MDGYNSAEVNEAKRRLLEYTTEIRRTGAPHQQPLTNDIDTLFKAHTNAVEAVGTLEQQLKLADDYGKQMVVDRDVAIATARVAEDMLARYSGALGVASTEGKTLADIRADIAKGPLST